MQWFRNVQLYRLPTDYSFPSLTELDTQLQKHAFVGCGSRDMNAHGWVAPARHAPDLLAYPQQNALLLSLQVEDKLLPASVIKQFVDEKIAAIEAHDQRNVGKKERRELTELMRDELLPRAFTRQRTIRAILDLQQRLVIVDSANTSRAEVLLSALRDTLGSFPARLIHTHTTAGTAMTLWLEHGAPVNFSLDADCELREAGDGGAVVRYQRQNLDSAEVKNHLDAGKMAVKLAISWNDRISFILTDKFEIKRISMLDLLADSLKEQDTDSEDGLFDASLALMIGEFRLLVPELITTLGGEEA